MLAQALSPGDAYRRVDLDARIEGSSEADLGDICLEAIVNALRQAIIAGRSGNTALRSAALVRANAIVLGLERSIDTDLAIGEALKSFYQGASAIILASCREYAEEDIARLRDDISEIHAQMYRGETNAWAF